MEKQLSAHQFKEIYESLGIDLNNLGCVMLDTYSIELKDSAKYRFYTSNNSDRFWIKGWVAGETPHVTLLYGLLSPATEIAKQIKAVLSGWTLNEIQIEDVDFFDSPYEDDPYYCIIAKVKTSDNLLEGHNRLQFLPHINTFAGYLPHLTLAYIEKDETQRDALIAELRPLLKDKILKIKPKLNLGGDK